MYTIMRNYVRHLFFYARKERSSYLTLKSGAVAQLFVGTLIAISLVSMGCSKSDPADPDPGIKQKVTGPLGSTSTPKAEQVR